MKTIQQFFEMSNHIMKLGIYSTNHVIWSKVEKQHDSVSQFSLTSRKRKWFKTTVTHHHCWLQLYWYNNNVAPSCASEAICRGLSGNTDWMYSGYVKACSWHCTKLREHDTPHSTWNESVTKIRLTISIMT